MQKYIPFFILVFTVCFAIPACQAEDSPTPGPSPELVTILPTPVPPTGIPQPAVTKTPSVLPFEAAVYRDESAGFELDYPLNWSADMPLVGGDRGYFAQITSWPRSPGELPDEIPEDGTILSINVLLWDPKNDLQAYIDTRKQAWSASGFEIQSEQEIVLDGDWPALTFRVDTPDQTTFFLITTIDNQYLVLSGSGDLEAVQTISRTLRRLPDQN